MSATTRPFGGVPHTRRVAITSTAQLLTTAIVTAPHRLAVRIVQDDTVDVFLGGADVTASGATKGMPLLGTPSTTPPSTPDSFSESISDQALYGIVASGTGHVIVCEWY